MSQRISFALKQAKLNQTNEKKKYSLDFLAKT